MSIRLGKLKFDAVDYGVAGSAILGIRGSGKSYTATTIAEQLFDAGIPFVAFDPIGQWRFLRVPGKGKGYPVVVAGGREGDLPLTVASAPEIVRSAMRSGISLVIDLFDINLSKADWKRIVTGCVRVLLHENSEHGLRHIFIEEASEFCPQRVGPDQGQVYAEIEKLARMGGNSLGSAIGGMLQDNTAEIYLNDTSNHIAVNGVDMYAQNSGGPLFLTATGYSGNTISVQGGVAYNYSALYNFNNGWPNGYTQDVPGWPKIDTNQSQLSITSTGGVGIGGIARAGTSFDLGATTSPMVFPAGTTATRPSTPIQGEFWNNASTGYPEIYTNGWNSIFPSPPGYINGLQISNDATNPTTTLDIGAGSATSDDGLTNIYNPFAYQKTTAAWAGGWGQGALDNGTIAANTWYAIFDIDRVDTSTSDWLFSTSATLPKMPANYTKKRLVGFFVTDGSAHILNYTITHKANGVDRYAYTATPTLDVVTTSLGTTATTYSLNVPTGVPVSPIVEVSIGNMTTAPTAMYVSSLDEADLAPTTSNPFAAAPGYSLQILTTGGIVSNTFDGGLMTSTTGSIRLRSTQPGTGASIITKGFEFCPGCNYSPVGSIAIDGTSAIATTTSATATLNLTTVSGNDVIVVTQAGYGNGGISAISDTTSLSWVNAYTSGVNGPTTSFWYAISPSPLSNDTISLTMITGGISYSQAMGVAAANTTTPIDPHAGLPYFTSQGFAGANAHASISTTSTTTHAKELVINVFSGWGQEGNPAPVQPTGYNNLIPPTGVNGTPSFAEWYGGTSFSYISTPLAGGSITYTFPYGSTINNMLSVPIQAANQ